MLYYQNRCRLAIIRWISILLGCWLLGVLPVSADEATARRIQISLPVFPRLVAVDKDFKHKLIAANKVLFVFLYESDPDNAKFLAESLQKKLANVAGFEFEARAVSIEDQLAAAPVPTAMFITEPLNTQRFTQVLEYAINQRRLIFSPLVGDVERGAMAGIAITSRVKPFFNITSLRRAEININPLLMNLSKIHE